MNIKIGNDVRVQIPISEFGNIDALNIKYATCTFTKLEDEDLSDPFSIFHHSSPYTVHGCGIPVYNVHPSHEDRCNYYTDHNCGHVVCGDPCTFVSLCTINNNNLLAVFPAEAQHYEGTYKCLFDIKVFEKGWDYDNLHSYRLKYNDVIKLTRLSGKDGSITITPDNTCDLTDTYLFAMSDSELSQLNGNYTSIILTVDGFNLESFLKDIKLLNISGTNKRIVLISKYNNILVMYNTFQFPMFMYTLDNGYYLYVSQYTYSNHSIPLNLSQSTTPNVSKGQDPFKGTSSSDDTPSTNPTNPPAEDTPTVNPTTVVNSISGSVLKITGVYLSNTIKTTGKINNYTMTL